MSLQSLKRKLKDDEVWVKYLNILRMAKTLNFSNIETEVTNLHKGRLSRSLMVERPNPDKIMKAVLQDASHRSRLTEIINSATYQSRMLNFTLDALQSHISSEYKVELSYCSTKAEREAVINSLLATGYDKSDEFDTMVKLCDNIIKDIDQMSWSIKNIINVLTLITERSSIIGTL